MTVPVVTVTHWHTSTCDEDIQSSERSELYPPLGNFEYDDITPALGQQGPGRPAKLPATTILIWLFLRTVNMPE